MIKLNSKVDKIPRIGPKYKKRLDKLDIQTVNDLIYHFPFRYNDYSKVKKISKLELGDKVTIKGNFVSVDNIYTKGRKRLTRAIFSDETAEIQIIWFNMHYIKKNIKIGEKYTISGNVSTFNNKLAFIAPQLEKTKKDSLNTGRLVPIYPETSGISSKWLRSRINDVINGLVNIEDFIPKDLIKKRGLVSLGEALVKFHFPESLEDVETAKKRFSYEELFIELLGVEYRKEKWKKKLRSYNFAVDKNKKNIEALKKSLPFELSKSQNEALSDIFFDLKKKHPMNRILEGDVGTGKTIVAIISAYLTYLNGYKTLYMAPTEILANQHYETFKEFLHKIDKNINISLKTGSSSEFDSSADIIIGTHALIYLEGTIENVGFIVIDEQQRFGVEQRAKLMDLGRDEKTPHLLTMTATPIPRTLALTLYGDLSMSTLDTPPDKYKNIKTWIVPEKKRLDAYGWIKKQKQPLFIICPLIEESEIENMAHVKSVKKEYEVLKEGPFKNYKIGMVHGAMSPSKKQEEIDKFSSGKLDVLVATPIIEVGTDIPDVNIMIIESPERFGLASLHQLRGRIGRKGGDAYCMLFPSKYSKRSIKRLKYLTQYNNGLKLAELDMKMRGQGDIYGTQQHGFISFKIADPYDKKMIDMVSEDVRDMFLNIKEYPKLKDKLESKTVNMVENN